MRRCANWTHYLRAANSRFGHVGICKPIMAPTDSRIRSALLLPRWLSSGISITVRTLLGVPKNSCFSHSMTHKTLSRPLCGRRIAELPRRCCSRQHRPQFSRLATAQAQGVALASCLWLALCYNEYPAGCEHIPPLSARTCSQPASVFSAQSLRFASKNRWKLRDFGPTGIFFLICRSASCILTLVLRFEGFHNILVISRTRRRQK